MMRPAPAPSLPRPFPPEARVILPPGLRIVLCLTPDDIRCGYDSLAGLVRNQLGDDPPSGTLFVFRSRDATRLKAIYWDRDGLAIG